jgi:hypothetical protein
MTSFKFFSPSEEATCMDEKMIMAIYSYQCALAESRVARKKEWKREVS